MKDIPILLADDLSEGSVKVHVDKGQGEVFEPHAIFMIESTLERCRVLSRQGDFLLVLRGLGSTYPQRAAKAGDTIQIIS